MAIYKVEKVGIEEATRQAVSLAGGLRIESETPVVIKPNLCEFRPFDTGATTDPRLLEALMKMLRQDFGDIPIKVVEADSTTASKDLVFNWLGYDKIVRKYDGEYINLTKARHVTVFINGYYLKNVKVAKLMTQPRFFITLPKLKTHGLTTISCCLKNQFGALPEPRKIVFHPKINEVIVDANLAMRPDLCIVDGIVSMEGGRAPTWGKPRVTNLIIAGPDPVAVDSACARIMGFDPNRIRHLRMAFEKGLGNMDFRLLGVDRLPEEKFDFSPLERLQVWFEGIWAS